MLKEERRRRGWGMREAAKYLGVALGTYEGWEKGWRQPGEPHWDKLADFLGVARYHVMQMVGVISLRELEALLAIPGFIKQHEDIALAGYRKRVSVNRQPLKALIAAS